LRAVWQGLLFLSALLLSSFQLALADSFIDKATFEKVFQQLLSKKANPSFIFNSENLTLEQFVGGSFGGRCKGIFDVVIETESVESLAVPCIRGNWSITSVAQGRIARVSQISPEASILVKQVATELSTAQRVIKISPDRLPDVIAKLRPGDRVEVEPGVLQAPQLDIPKEIGSMLSQPIVISGANRVTLSGRVRISIEAQNVTLSGFNFQGTDAETIIVTGQGFRLIHSKFDRCGNSQNTRSHCIELTGGAANSVIAFNEFSASQSMTIKVRENLTGGNQQPIGISIHHNIFRDIIRLSGNGQEPIQIAGENGGDSKVTFNTHIDHNIFLRTDGDNETISLKGPGNSVRWNVFYDTNSSPNLRGAANNALIGNLLVNTRAIRIAGSGNRIEKNYIICPTQPFAILMSLGSEGYRAAKNTIISKNLLVGVSGIRFAPQTWPITETVDGNTITTNEFVLERNNKALFGEGGVPALESTNSLVSLDEHPCKSTR
jgi:hypothetical protein